jgi:hypothetical protein
MNTHDVLAFAVGTEAVRRVRAGLLPWKTILSADSYITASRSWPMPDFVLADSTNGITVAGEFKPPKQSKREYLTGLGQVVAYVRDFNYGLLILPTIADDGYLIAEHVRDVLAQAPLTSAPIGLLSYDPALLSTTSPGFTELHFFSTRLEKPTTPATLDQSFYAKWREMSPEEAFLYLSFSYDEMRSPIQAGTIRDRAFDHLWSEIQSSRVHHWAGGVRHYKNDARMKVAVLKNYRNFLFHLSWTDANGALTRAGLEVLHIGAMYGPNTRPFLDAIALAALVEGKHLILFNAISEFQDRSPDIRDEQLWLQELESFLEDKGLLKRNPARAAAAKRGSARQFLKAEKQLWRQLELIVPRKLRVFHPGRGFIFNWARITELLQNGGI